MSSARAWRRARSSARPPRPRNFTATAGDARVSLAWEAPASNGGSSILQYQYRYAEGSTVQDTETWTDVPDGDDPLGLTSDERAFVVAPLTNGTEYAFEVRAVNVIGGGTKAGPETATPNSVNTAPVFADATLDRSVPENSPAGTNVGTAIPEAVDGEGDTLTYTMEGTDAASFDFNATTRQITTKSGVTYDFEADASYSVTVKADDRRGGTDTVEVAIALTDVDEPPAAPAAPTVTPTPGSTTSLDVSWTAPGNAGRPPIVSYDLRYCAGSDSDCATPGDFSNGPQNVTGTSSTLAGLTPDTAYRVQVRATNDEGDGDWSGNGAGNTPATPNNAPTVLNPIPDRTATVDRAFWYQFPTNTFNDADNHPLTYTALKSDDSALPEWLEFRAETRVFSGTPGDGDSGTLEVKVTASDGFGGLVSDTFNIVVRAVAPGVPRSFTAGTGDGEVTLAWRAPASTGGAPVLRYQYRQAAGTTVPAGTAWTDIPDGDDPDSRAGNETRFVVTPAGERHQVRLRAARRERRRRRPRGRPETATPGVDPNANQAPVLINGIAGQSGMAGENFRLQIPGDTFDDPNGDELDYAAELVDGSPLPSWLHFDALQRVLSARRRKRRR